MTNCVAHLFKAIFFIIFLDGDVSKYTKISGTLNIKIFMKSEGHFSITIKEKTETTLKITRCLPLGL